MKRERIPPGVEIKPAGFTAEAALNGERRAGESENADGSPSTDACGLSAVKTMQQPPVSAQASEVALLKLHSGAAWPRF